LPDPYWLTKADLARDLQVAVNHIPRMAREGRIPEPTRFSETLVRWARPVWEEWCRCPRDMPLQLELPFPDQPVDGE
jgi:hypothetical protein